MSGPAAQRLEFLPFAKLHGLGNDYVYLTEEGAQASGLALDELARFVSDRNFGVGSDGLIVVGVDHAGDDGGDGGCGGGGGGALSMRMFNADGSESAMCGNGVRCATKFGIERRLASANPVSMRTGKGTVVVEWFRDGSGAITRARVDMGEPELGCSSIPAVVPGVANDSSVVGRPISDGEWVGFGVDGDWAGACGLVRAATLVSMGNPHLVMFCADVAAVPLESVGPRLERASWFPKRTNVHVVQCGGSRGSPATAVRMRTWERGSGITQACGSGACAVVVAGVLEGRLARRVDVRLPGGTLAIEWSPGGHVVMEGGCTAVFEGALNLSTMDEWRRVRGGTA